MRASRPVSLICIPITLTGLLMAHSLAYALVTRSEADARALLATTGHGYLSLAHTLVLSVGAGLVATGVLLRLQSGHGGAWRAGWAVAAPVLAFAVQEHVERLAYNGSFPAHLFIEPVFLIGLALQIPFGLLAVILARSLLVFVDTVRVEIRRPFRGATPARPTILRLTAPQRVRTMPLARRGASRAPPHPLGAPTRAS